MSVALTLLTLLPLIAAPAGGSDPVRISLFSLFKPQLLDVRIGPGSRASIEAAGITRRELAAGDSIRAQSEGARLSLILIDSFGRIKESAVARELRITPLDGGVLELSLPGKIRRAVRGELSVAARDRVEGGALQVVLVTGRESAVASVVAAEITGEREPEALKALAVVVRTFLLSHAGRHRREGFDFCDTTHCQLYRGEEDLSSQSVTARAVAQTAGEFLSYEGRAIEGHYTTCCGGLTATPEMVWGGPGASNYSYRRVRCHWCGASRFSRWGRSAGDHRVLSALSVFTGTRLSQATEIVVEGEAATGFVRAVVIRDRQQEKTMSADEFRRAIGRALGWNTVLSPTFAIERRAHSFVFRGRGFGSQVGLCLEGSASQAKAARSYLEILSFYFPQANVSGRTSGAGSK